MDLCNVIPTLKDLDDKMLNLQDLGHDDCEVCLAARDEIERRKARRSMRSELQSGMFDGTPFEEWIDLKVEIETQGMTIKDMIDYLKHHLVSWRVLEFSPFVKGVPGSDTENGWSGLAKDDPPVWGNIIPEMFDDIELTADPAWGYRDDWM